MRENIAVKQKQAVALLWIKSNFRGARLEYVTLHDNTSSQLR